MTDKNLEKIIMVARGYEKADLVLKNAKIVNVFTGELVEKDLAIVDGYIAGLGQYEGIEELDLKGKIISPGFIDGHVHIESSMAIPSEFAKLVLPRGVTSVIADPHEIANIKGRAGIEFIIEDSKNSLLDVYIVLPSCVPATSFESSGAVLLAEDLEELLIHKEVIGLGEMMNFPGVLNLDREVLRKLDLAKDLVIDGHSPLLTGKDLNAYVAAGINTEHEAASVEEALERVELGMYVLIRQGSAARDLKNIIKAVNSKNLGRFLFCTDDKHPEDLINEGSIDYNIRLAIKYGMDPIDAITIASINAAQCYGLKNKGAIAPGYMADLVIIDNFNDFNILNVFKKGKLISAGNISTYDGKSQIPGFIKKTVNIPNIDLEDLQIKMKTNRANLISIENNSLITRKVSKEVSVVDGLFQYSSKDILKIAVIERHKSSGNIGLGLIENFGLEQGAIGTTISHDSHNLIVVGKNDQDILRVIEEIKAINGGIAMVLDGQVIGSLPLEIAGIMSSRSIFETNKILSKMLDDAGKLLKVNKNIDPFMTLSFMALPVIPDIKLTDKGLFDVVDFKFIEVCND